MENRKREREGGAEREGGGKRERERERERKREKRERERGGGERPDKTVVNAKGECLPTPRWLSVPYIHAKYVSGADLL